MKMETGKVIDLEHPIGRMPRHLLSLFWCVALGALLSISMSVGSLVASDMIEGSFHMDDVTASVGQVRISAYKSGLVERGQKVLVHLDNYPAGEFGALEGRVTELVTSGGGYVVLVTFASPRVTTGGMLLKRHIPLSGTARIVLSERKMAFMMLKVFNERLNQR